MDDRGDPTYAGTVRFPEGLQFSGEIPTAGGVVYTLMQGPASLSSPTLAGSSACAGDATLKPTIPNSASATITEPTFVVDS
ncbi:hypothetical protein BRD56_03875 [Thermoplasmatales archaeon SW_10_69_26]|nr:MAG: hypothetical protein BRD56_03875 [Thermoplasmatales archaeon SW_10_69_26]